MNNIKLETKQYLENLIMIAAIGKNNELGQDNKLIWPLKEDLKYFRNQTMGKKIVMGYNTFLSLPKILPGRKHLILTHRDIELDSNIEIYHSKEEVLQAISMLKEEVYIIGGASIYKQFIDNAGTLLLTEIDATCKEADAFFPEFNKNIWASSLIDNHNENDINYRHMKYVRKK